jgi:hypothetical protein
MGPVIYFLDALISLVCFALLWRGYARSKNQLLFWSAICFFGLGCSNGLLFIDLAIFPASVNLFTWRLAVTALSLLCLLYGLVWERE